MFFQTRTSYPVQTCTNKEKTHLDEIANHTSCLMMTQYKSQAVNERYFKVCSFYIPYSHIRYLSRFFDRWAHVTMYAYIGNKHFFTKSCHHQTYQNSKISWQKMCLILLIKGFKNWSFQKMPITIYVPLNWYSSMKKKLRKIRIIFDIEKSLWKSEIGIFCQLILEFW